MPYEPVFIYSNMYLYTQIYKIVLKIWLLILVPEFNEKVYPFFLSCLPSSVRTSVCQYLQPPSVHTTVQVRNSETLSDTSTKLGTNIKHHEIVDKTSAITPPTLFTELCAFEIFSIQTASSR